MSKRIRRRLSPNFIKKRGFNKNPHGTPSNQPIILAIYVNVSNLDDRDVKDYITKISEGLKLDGSLGFTVQQYVILVRNQETKIEVLNPIRIPDDEFYLIKQKLDKAKEILENFTQSKQETLQE